MDDEITARAATASDRPPTAKLIRIEDHTYGRPSSSARTARLRAVVGCSEAGLRTACITKVFPTRLAPPLRPRAASRIAPGQKKMHPGTTGAGTCTKPSRGRTGSATRTRSNTGCATRPMRLRARGIGALRFAHRGRQRFYQGPFGGMTLVRQGPGAAHCARRRRTGHRHVPHE